MPQWKSVKRVINKIGDKNVVLELLDKFLTIFKLELLVHV